MRRALNAGGATIDAPGASANNPAFLPD